MSTSYRHKNTSVSLINYHFVWIPRRRRRVLVGDVEQRLKELIYQLSELIECKVIALEIMPDHVHLFVNAPPDIAPDQIMFRIKGASSRHLREEFPHLKKMPSMWTRSYFCGTAGNASSQAIEKYIKEQKST